MSTAHARAAQRAQSLSRSLVFEAGRGILSTGCDAVTAGDPREVLGRRLETGRRGVARGSRRRGHLAGSALLALLVGCDEGESVGNGPPVTKRTPPSYVDASRDAGAPRADVPPPPPLRAPPTFTTGFTDLTEGIEREPPFILTPPSAMTGGEPDFTAGVFGPDGMVIFQRRSPSFEPFDAQVRRYDPVAGRLVVESRPTTPQEGRDWGVCLALDLDGDGRTDFLTARPHHELLWGREGGVEAPTGFTPVVADRYVPFWASLNVADVDDDGWLDVITGTSACCVICRDVSVFLRTGARAFADRTALVQEAPAGTGVAVMSVALEGEQALLALGNPCGNQDAPGFYHQRGRDAEGFPRYERFDPMPADAYFRVRAADMKRDRAITMWSPMGAAAADLDDDGRTDLGISLNYYIGRYGARGALPLYDGTGVGGPPETRADGGRAMIPWGIAYIDLDQDGHADQIAAHGNDSIVLLDPAQHIGPQFVTVGWNAGNFHFVDVTTALGVGRRGQWRSLAVGDLEGDGDADLIVGGIGEMPRVYRNDIRTGNHGFSLRLRGTSSNPLGLGAVVEVRARADGPTQRFVANALASPFVASEPLVFVGLGASPRAASVRVTWPSGTVQEVADLAGGTLHTLTEPALFVVDPPSRRVTARGAAMIRVTPRRADGSVRADARVAVVVAHGSARVEGAPSWDGEAFVVRIAAPPTSGSSVLDVRVDDQVMGVHPRIWWE